MDQTAWNTCQHGSYFFLSWHRMYLYYFERILREASRDPNFALPY
ncbi:MAG: tyrosinase family protein [Nitrospiraceae bacterium]